MKKTYLKFFQLAMKFEPVFLLAVILCIPGCSDYGEVPGKSPKLTQTVTGLYMFEAQKGETRWILEAKKADIFENNSKADLTEPVIYFKEKGKTVSKLEAETGLLDLDTKNVELTRKVKVKSLKENIFLTTDKLNYSFDENKFFTDSYVKIKQSDAIVEGRGLKADSDLSEIVIYNQKTKLPKK